MYYYLSLGTNIDPKANAVRIVKALIKAFDAVQVLPYVETAPVDIKTGKTFLNAICVIETDLSAQSVKQITNKIEGELGRDRSHPLSSERDRPADIDTLCASEAPVDYRNLLGDEPYVNAVIYSHPQKRVDLSRYGLPTIDRPTTVDLDADTGEIVVVDDEVDRFHQTLKAAL